MMERPILSLIISSLCFLSAFAQVAGLEPVVVEAEGVAAWRKPYERAQQEAIHNALMQAIEQACGVQLARFELGRNGSLEHTAQVAFAQGIVLRWQRLGATRLANGCLYVKVRAEVVPLSQLNSPNDWREVWQTIGHPPLGITVRVEGEPGLQPLAQHALQTVLLDALHEMGIHPRTQADARCWQLVATLQMQPRKRWGDADAPYGLGNLFASWQAQLTLQIIPPTADKTARLLCQRESIGVSLTSDGDAVQRAIRKVVMEPHADWRITLATLWLHHLMGMPDSFGKSVSPNKKPEAKEVRNDAKQNSRHSTVASNGKRAPSGANPRPNRPAR
jgi:hypothetical protein